MGRPRTPTHLKLVKGTAQPCRTNKREPKPEKARPSAPAHLSDKARETWGYVSGLVERMGVLTGADGLALEGLCESYAELLAARAALKAHGTLSYETTSATGGMMVRAYPEVAMVADADRRFRMWLSAFGLSPSDRSRVSAGEPDTKNPFADLG